MLDVNKIHYLKKDGMNRLLYELVQPYPLLKQVPVVKPQWDEMAEALRANVRSRLAVPPAEEGAQPSAEMYGLILQPFRSNSVEMSLPLNQDILVKAKGFGGPQQSQVKRLQSYSYTSRTYSLTGNGHAVDVRQLVRFENAKDSKRKIMTGMDAYAIQVREFEMNRRDKLAMFLRTCPSSQDQPYSACAGDALKSLMLFSILKR